MRVLLVTDSFPPGCGGSGWSTYELARGLRARQHEILIVQPRPNQPHRTREFDGFTIHEFGAAAPNLPYVRNVFKNERLYRRLAPFVSDIIGRERVDIVHGQHVLSGPPAVAAATEHRVPVVLTVRDYWPVCYWSDILVDPQAGRLCPECSNSRMVQCVKPRAGIAWPAAIPFIPYMASNLVRKQAALAQSDAVIAVSQRLATDLRERLRRSTAFPGPPRIEVIPNPVDVQAVIAARRGPRPVDAPDGPYALFVGKLASNKGVLPLLHAVERSRMEWPLIVVGDGPNRADVERQARDRGVDARLQGWLDREEAWRWMAYASMLIFPSTGPETLSRVLLESMALGLPIAALDTGGTSELILHERTGLLASDIPMLAHHIARLAGDAGMRARIGAAARNLVLDQFQTNHVVARIEHLYQELLSARVALGQPLAVRAG